MKIVLCDDAMINALCDFYDKVTLYLEHHTNYPKWIYKVYPARESVMQAVQSHTQYACIDGGDIVGAFVLNNDPQGDYGAGAWSQNLRECEFFVIHSLAVLPERTRKGIAVHMVNYAVDYARKNGAKAIRLDIVPTNYPAQKLYEKSGFRYAGEYDLKRGFGDIPTFCLYELNL